MITLEQLRGNELINHDKALRQEFADWRAASREAAKPFAKHKTQILRITGLLTDFLDQIDAANVPANFGKQERAYSHLLGIYRIWSYFRSKFIMRADARLRDMLRCADELAWACYQPARLLALDAGKIDDGALKEPPLVFFSGDATPFAQARATPFMPEGLDDRDIENFAEMVLALPIPVIGIPWFQINQLVSLTVVAHEVGHAVEADFQLETELDRAITDLNLDPERETAWLKWRKEIFADIYACICVGPAFLIALMDYLVGDPEKVQKEERRAGKWGDYPTRTLRILLNIEVLDQLGLLPVDVKPQKLSAFLADVRQTWTTAYPQHRMQPFVEDIRPVVKSLLKTKPGAFGDVALADVVTYETEQLKHSWLLSGKVLSRTEFPLEAEAWSFREKGGAPVLAYGRNPQKYFDRDANTLALQLLLDAIPEGVRSADDEDNAEMIARKQAADHALVQTFAGLFPG